MICWSCLNNFDILSGSEVFLFILSVRPPAVGQEYFEEMLLSLFLSLQNRDQAGNMN